MRYFAHTSKNIEAMLKTIGLSSLDDLFSSIPQEARLSSPLKLPAKMDELHLKRELAPFASPLTYLNFLGAGACEHFVPEWISEQLRRAEWYTSYTPYQPEASQGTLQAIFEFQSMVASLFGLDTANASMYDGATALVEALLLALRASGRKSVLLSKAIHPEYRKTVYSYLAAAGFRIEEIGLLKNGTTDLDELERKAKKIGSDLAAIACQSPNFFGRIEEFEDAARLSKTSGALMIGVCTDMSASALFRSFGAMGADIAVGEGLGLLGALSLGGPGVGLFACKRSLLRQMPGRLVGATTDRRGALGYVLTLSTREQHIRREKATSNICTNHNLMALALAMTLAAYGQTGFYNLASSNLKKTLLFRRYLRDYGHQALFLGPHYNETVVKLGCSDLLKERLKTAYEHKIVAGLPLGSFYPDLEGSLLIATTELHEDSDIKRLAMILSGAL